MPVKKFRNCTGAVSVSVLIIVAVVAFIGTGVLISDDVHGIIDKVLVVVAMILVITQMEHIIKLCKGISNAI